MLLVVVTKGMTEEAFGLMSALADSDIQTMALIHHVAPFSFCCLKLPLPDHTELHTWLKLSSLDRRPGGNPSSEQ